MTSIRLGLIGAVLGGLALLGAVSYFRTPKPEPAAAAVPGAPVPGYTGPLYDASGKLVGYSQPDRPAAPAAPAQTMARPLASAGRPARKPRSTAKSVAIVGGSAGVGAAIGGLAGGGKGAAIGALSGGGAGFVYDRLTRNK